MRIRRPRHRCSCSRSAWWPAAAGASDGTEAADASADSGLVRHADRLRRRLAHRRLHRTRRPADGGQPRPGRPVQLRRQLGAGHADRRRARPRTSSPRPTSSRWPSSPMPGSRPTIPRSSPRTCWRSPCRRATPATSPGWPTSRDPDLTLAVCAPPVPCGAAAAAGLRGGGRHRRARHRGGGRPRRAHQGAARRGRRRPGLRHRRAQRRRRRRGHRLPRGRGGGERLPDLRPRRRPEPRRPRRRSSTWCSPTRGRQALGRRRASGRRREPARRDGRAASRRRCWSRPRSASPSSSCRWSVWWSGRRGRRSGPQLAEPGVGQALRLSLVSATTRHRRLAACSACRSPGCWPAPASAAAACCAPWSPSRWCCRPVVGGVALFLVLGRQGIIGSWLDDTFGITIPFTTHRRRHRRDVRRHAVPRDQRRGRAAGRRRPVRGRRRHARRRPVDDVPPRHPAAGRARASPPARCSAGPGRWASSAPRSPSRATSRGRRRRCRWRSTWRCSATPRPPIVLSLVLLAVSLATLLLLRDRWLGRVAP